MKIVIALGGNALGETPELQKETAVETAKLIVPIIKKGHDVIITHGNGPQVGLINLAFSEGKKINDRVYEMPIAECTAMSQGYIGYHLQNALQNELKDNHINKSVVSVVTQIEVDENDEAFKDSTKPIGPYYSLEEAKELPYPMKEQSRGYRRVVPSPKPVKVLEENLVKELSSSNCVVITCGGGGIPVIKKGDSYKGIDAVIDKDFASSKLADDIDADMLMILTAIDSCSINFRQPGEKKLGLVTVDELIKYNDEGHFSAGSMKPKVEACIEFVGKKKNRHAIITSIEHAIDALEDKCGTRVINK